MNPRSRLRRCVGLSFAGLAEGLAERGPVTVLSSRSGAPGTARTERRGNLLIRRLFTIEAAHVPFMPSLLVHLLRLPRNAIVHGGRLDPGVQLDALAAAAEQVPKTRRWRLRSRIGERKRWYELPEETPHDD